MNLKRTNVPLIRSESTVASMMRDALFALVLLLVLPVVRYGFRPAVMAVVTGAVCAVSEVLFNLIRKLNRGLSDCSPMVTGFIIALMMPVNATLWLPCTAGLFAILVAKGPFGSTGRNPFNPAAAGIAFVTVCWPSLVFSYCDPELVRNLPLFADCSVPTAVSPDAVLKSGLKPQILPFDMLWGDFPGPVGTTAVLVVAACGLYLFLKRTARWEITAFFLAAAAFIAAFFPRIACSAMTSVKYELLSGSLLFCSVFLVTDPVTAPHTTAGRCMYGAFAGAMVMVFRRYGAYQQGAVFAVLIANALAPLMDDLVFRARGWGSELREI